MNGKVIDSSKLILVIPSNEIIKEEKKLWVLFPVPVDWFRKRKRVIIAFEITTPDEKAWEDVDTFIELVTTPFIYLVLVLFFVEMYRLGITNYDDMIPYWEDFAHAPDWMEFFNAVVQARNKRKWWEKVKPKFEELKQKVWDDLKAKGKFVGYINFAEATRRNTVEELEKYLWELVNVNGVKKAMDTFGENWRETCWKFVIEKVKEHNQKLSEVPSPS